MLATVLTTHNSKASVTQTRTKGLNADVNRAIDAVRVFI